MNRHHTWLHTELPKWQQDQLISSDQAAALRARYPLADSGWGLAVLSVIGAVLLGLGVILILAFNWALMPKWLKLLLVFVGLGGTHLAAMRLAEQPHHQRLSQALHVLGSMLFGAAIWLVAQVYHIDDHYPNAFIAWSLGTLLLAWALPSLAQAMLALTLIMVWQTMEVFDFDRIQHLAPLLLLLGLLPLALRLRSPLLAWSTAASLILSLVFNLIDDDTRLGLLSLLLVGGSFVALRHPLSRLSPEHEGVAQALASPGRFAFLLLLYLLAMPEFSSEILEYSTRHPERSGYFIAMLGAALAAWGWALSSEIRAGSTLTRVDVGLMITTTLLALIYTYGGGEDPGWAPVILFNLLFFGHAVLLILEGSHTGQRRALILGGLMIALLAMSRFLDLFDSLLARSLVFLVVGGLLFSAGSFYRRARGDQAK